MEFINRLNHAQNETIDTAIKWSALFMIPPLIMSVMRFYKLELLYYAIPHVLFTLFLIFLYQYRRNLSIVLKTHLFCSTYLMLSFFALFVFKLLKKQKRRFNSFI